MEWLGQFQKRLGFVGIMLATVSIAYLVSLGLLGILGEHGFEAFWAKATLPADLSTAVRQPYSILSYVLGYHPMAIWLLFVDLVVLYTFGRILNDLLGDRRMQAIVVIGWLGGALLTIGIANLLPTVEMTANTRLFGLGIVNATIITALMTLVPHHSVRVLVWEVPLFLVGLFVMGASLAVHRAFFTLEGTGELVGMALGFGIIKSLRTGWDLTNWFRGAANRPPASIPRQPEPVMSSQRPVVRSIHQKPKPAPQANPQPPMTEAEELDFLLDKINDVGYAGLSQAEKERLDLLSGK